MYMEVRTFNVEAKKNSQIIYFNKVTNIFARYNMATQANLEQKDQKCFNLYKIRKYCLGSHI